MTEQKIQKKRIDQLEAEGYYVLKLISTNKNGIPDLIAVHPEKGVLFSEVKRPKTGRLSELQKFRIKELIDHGFNVEIFNGKSIVLRRDDEVLKGVRSKGEGPDICEELF